MESLIGVQAVKLGNGKLILGMGSLIGVQKVYLVYRKFNRCTVSLLR